MRFLVLILAGLAWPFLLNAPPADHLLAALLLATVSTAFASLRWRVFLGPALVLAFSLLSVWHIDRALGLRLPQSYDTSLIDGTIVSLPVQQADSWLFVFLAQSGPWGPGQRRLEVRWSNDPGPAEEGSTRLRPEYGDRWRLPLRLRAPRGRVNFSGEDQERRWFAARVHGLASVRGPGALRLASGQGTAGGRWRAQVRERLILRLGDLPGSGLVLALGLGDRSALSPAIREAMRGTGTGHLLAISGLHVGLVGSFAFLMARLLFCLTGWRHAYWPAERLALIPAVLAATAYAVLAGFGTSPRRALVMLAVVAAAIVVRRRIDPWHGWLLALVLVLVLDPFALLQAGFWLSFGAVAVLLHQFQGRVPAPRGIPALLQAQVGIGLAMLPLGLAWFQWGSASALPANLLAIPWVSLISLPLVLLTLLGLPFDGWPAQVVAAMAAGSAELLERGLVSGNHRLAALAGTSAKPGPILLCVGMLGGLLCLLPGAFRLRLPGLLMLVPLWLPATAAPGPGDLRLELLDVGQGQAAFVQTHRHLLLVDTGPGIPGRWDLAQRVVLPAARQLRAKPPELMLVSHADMDHAGGRVRLQQLWPGTAVLGSFPRPLAAVADCHEDRAWHWDGADFAVLHPTRWLPYRGNDSSCVLAIRSLAGAMLLPGDVSKLVERRMLLREADNPHGHGAGNFDLLVAPHHGSASSSSPAWLDWVSPRLVLFAVGHENRFSFPHEEVLRRYRQRAQPMLSTADCGAIRVELTGRGRLSWTSARRVRQGVWRWPATAACEHASTHAFRYHSGHSNKTIASKE